MNKFYFFILLSFLCSIAQAQDLYDLNKIQTIKIVFTESNWDALLDEKKASDEGYLMAQSVTINDLVFNKVGVQYKGNSTYRDNQKKNPFHIELDTYKDQDYDGYTDIKLSNVANDPSFVREVLSYQILRQYMDAPLSNYANVYVNGAYVGLYVNSESVSKEFLKSHFGSSNNTFVKCNPADGAGPGSRQYPNLEYLGADSTKYYGAYEMKSDEGWKDLIHLCDKLSNNITDIEKILDVDKVLWMLAFDNALVNLDSYIGMFSQNYYLYRDANKRFVPVVWDLNESFGRFAQAGSTNLNSTADKQKLNPLLNANNSKFPLVKMLLSVPMYKRMYLAHLKTIMLENFDNQTYYKSALSLQHLIDSSVNGDANKFFSYSDFKSNLTTDISGGNAGSGDGPPPPPPRGMSTGMKGSGGALPAGLTGGFPDAGRMPGGGLPGMSGGMREPGGGATPGITNLMNGRNSYLLALPDLKNAAPSITNINVSDSSPAINTIVTISASVTSPTAVYLGYRKDVSKPFARIQMYDDGTHTDKKAKDGIYSTSINIKNTKVQYYVYAENSKAGMFSPRRAEYEYYSIKANTNNLSVSKLVINEFMASNQATITDKDKKYEDWVEFHNNSTSKIDLSGYALSNDANDLRQWKFPAGTSIAAGDYLIVWADKDKDQSGLHASFKISKESGSLFLSDAAGSLIDKVSYNNQTDDVSYGRTPNGTGSFQKLAPTFKAKN